MRKIIAAAVALSLMMLWGCGSDGEYYTKEKHVEKEKVSLADDNSSNVTGYYTLKGAIMNMVNMAVAEDVLKIGEYSGDLDTDLQAVINEITTVDPIGIYGVSSINIEQTRVLTYREVSVSIQYKKSPEEIRNIVSVGGEYELLNRISLMLDSFGSSAVFAVSDSDFVPQDIEKIIYALWMRTGARAIGLDGVSVSEYPEESERFILELDAVYIMETEELERLAEETDAKAAEAAALIGGESMAERISGINAYLAENVVFDTSAQRVVNEMQGSQRKTGVYTACGAFIEGEAAQSGFVLAASAMLEHLGIEHTVETGTVGDDIWSWIVINADGESWIFDPTAIQAGREDFFAPESEIGENYIKW
ncbi:MAG: hypothetical protein IJD03_00730 [Clostridia bacterium]|nr:hypothetical protein [Clostridia bacterium]